LRPGRNPPTHPIAEINHVIYQPLGPESGGRRGDQDQPFVGHQSRLVEDHLHTVGIARYSPNCKCLLGSGWTAASVTAILPGQEALLVDGQPPVRPTTTVDPGSGGVGPFARRSSPRCGRPAETLDTSSTQ